MGIEGLGKGREMYQFINKFTHWLAISEPDNLGAKGNLVYKETRIPCLGIWKLTFNRYICAHGLRHLRQEGIHL